NAVGAIHDDGTPGDFGERLHENSPLFPEPFHHVAVVNNFMEYINRRAESLQRLVQTVHGHVDAGTTTPGAGKEHFHARRLDWERPEIYRVWADFDRAGATAISGDWAAMVFAMDVR